MDNSDLSDDVRDPIYPQSEADRSTKMNKLVTVNVTPRVTNPDLNGELSVKAKTIIANTRLAASITPREATWIWKPYIPAGFVSIIEGDPGIGKSLLSCAIAADLSAGRPLPGDTAKAPQKVLILTQEDSAEYTIMDRLKAHEANMENIYVNDTPWLLDSDGLSALAHMLVEMDVAIVFLDPLVAYLGGKVDMHRANETRAAMGPLVEIASNTGCAVVLVRHLRKAQGEGDNAKYRGIGSIDLIAAARSAVQVHELSETERDWEHIKHNLSPPGPTLSFRIEDQRVVWGGKVSPKIVNKVPRAIGIAKQFLIEELSDGPVPSSTLQERAAAKGITAKSLFRAKEGVAETYKDHSGPWVWSLIPGILPPPTPDPVLLVPETPPDKLSELVRQAKQRLGVPWEPQ